MARKLRTSDSPDTVEIARVFMLCPRCGGRPVVRFAIEDGETRGQVRCEGCDRSTADGLTFAEAKAIWNRRPLAPA